MERNSPTPQPDTFDELLRTFRQRADRSRHSVAQEAGVDVSYLARLELGQRIRVSVPFVDALARVLKVSSLEHSRLRVAAGYVPLPVLRLGRWDPILDEAAELLEDDALPLAERHAYCRELLRVCALYRGIARRQARTMLRYAR